MNILIEPKPFENESFISWFCRTSFLNGSDPKSFALSIWKKDSMFYKDLDRFISYQDLYEISKCSSLSLINIRQLTLESYINDVDTSPSQNQYKKWYFILPLAQKGKIRTNGIHFCPECLKSNIPIINRYWRLSWFIICPIHKIELILNCPQCNQVFSPEKQDYLNPHLYLCSNCKYDLRKINLKTIDHSFIQFQNELTNIFNGTTVNFTFELLETKSKQDLFLTLFTLVAFAYKILRQPKRFNSLIDALEIDNDYKFDKIHNGIFSRLSAKNRFILLQITQKILQYKSKVFVDILKSNGITQQIFQQTFKNISPTIRYILSQLSDKKLQRIMPKVPKNILPKEPLEVEKLFDDLKPFIKNYYATT